MFHSVVELRSGTHNKLSTEHGWSSFFLLQKIRFSFTNIFKCFDYLEITFVPV
ncbi:hypothetical protein HMPREF1870_01555 [Bacteroidales bacterium KA00344]|nr:hypothetical protein HMPREF1870_01555 [Bacteroidales bacterium KA00344]